MMMARIFKQRLSDNTLLRVYQECWVRILDFSISRHHKFIELVSQQWDPPPEDVIVQAKLLFPLSLLDSKKLQTMCRVR